MAQNPAPIEQQPRVRNVNTLLNFVIVITGLYFAREVLIPLALAILVAFLLAPLAIRLRHWKLGRVASSLIVVALSFALVSGICTFVSTQLSDLVRKLPTYQQNIEKKVEKIRTSGTGIVTRITRLSHSINEGFNPAPPSTQQQQPANGNAEKPVPVEIRKNTFSPFEFAQKLLGSILNVFLTLAIVTVFVIFILIQREDLRDRLIKLAGAGRLNVTTQAMDDAADRLSRYLLAQLLVNVAFGAAATVGLYFIKVPNPVLWGIIAVIMRYIPYLGIWVAAVGPALLAFAVEVGWVKVPIIFGLYFGIDLVMYNFVEPYLYGNSTGTSPVAILVAAVFWTWLWGPVGLLLATPLTVCVAVMGRYIPSMQFLGVLLSDEPVLSPQARFYQRMLALDIDEATEVAEEYLEKKPIEKLEDEVIIPALTMAEEDRHNGKLDAKREQFIFENTRMLMEHLAARESERKKDGDSPKADAARKAAATDESAEIVCIPAHGDADELASHMLGHQLHERGVAAKVLSCNGLAGECVESLKQIKVKVACVTIIPPYGYMHARYLCRRLHDEFPDLKVVAAVLTEKDVEEVRQRRPRIQADEIATTLEQAVAAVLSLAPTRTPSVDTVATAATA